MPNHSFKIGDTVRVSSIAPGISAGDVVKVMGLVGDSYLRIKNLNGKICHYYYFRFEKVDDYDDGLENWI